MAQSGIYPSDMFLRVSGPYVLFKTKIVSFIMGLLVRGAQVEVLLS